MGEVYRARDTKLDRDVAIKVLPEEFANDEERLARFEREAKLLASLHANPRRRSWSRHPSQRRLAGVAERNVRQPRPMLVAEQGIVEARALEGSGPIDVALTGGHGGRFRFGSGRWPRGTT